MPRLVLCLLLPLFLLLMKRDAAAEPVNLILDTDIGNDVDDALALAMIHAFENRGEVRLLAVTISKDNCYAAPYVNLLNTFYGRPGIPIGVVHHGKTPEDAAMLKTPAERRDANGAYIYPHQLEDGRNAPEAVTLLTRTLAAQPDHSVTIAQIGFSTNLARLVATPGGRLLVERKVKLLSMMAGNFQKSKPEYNAFTDAAAFTALMKSWPTHIVFSGFEIGLAITFPYQAIEMDFKYAVNHPVVDAYRLYVGKAADRANWDSTAVLEAIRPDRGYFGISAPGRVTLDKQNATVFVPDSGGKCRYLLLEPAEVARVRELIATLVSEPPLSSERKAASVYR
jgi:inosine-uridine nucleoside N-ribohydrolase